MPWTCSNALMRQDWGKRLSVCETNDCLGAYLNFKPDTGHFIVHF